MYYYAGSVTHAVTFDWVGDSCRDSCRDPCRDSMYARYVLCAHKSWVQYIDLVRVHYIDLVSLACQDPDYVVPSDRTTYTEVMVDVPEDMRGRTIIGMAARQSPIT